MLDLTAIHLAIRARARAVAVVTTGVTTLAATATGYTRTAGSFYDDGFWPGMEVKPVGFASAAPGVITKVSPLTLEIHGGRAADPAAAGRALNVGLPSRFQFEGNVLEPSAGEPFATEQFLPGPASQHTFGGPGGTIYGEPMYVLAIYVPDGSQMAASVYATRLLAHFPPRLALPLANGDVVRIRSDLAPFAGQLLAGPTGFQVKTISIPLRVGTSNSI